jgi:hypothetical protein
MQLPSILSTWTFSHSRVILSESSYSTSLLIRSWLLCIQHLPCLVNFGACLEVLWRFEQRTFFVSSLRTKTILACQEMLNEFGPLNQNRLLFIQFQTVPPRMHHKCKKIKLILYAKQQMENHRGPTSKGKSH